MVMLMGFLEVGREAPALVVVVVLVAVVWGILDDDEVEEVDEGAVVETEPNWTKGWGKDEAVEVSVEDTLTEELTPAVLLSLQGSKENRNKRPLQNSSP